MPTDLLSKGTRRVYSPQQTGPALEGPGAAWHQGWAPR